MRNKPTSACRRCLLAEMAEARPLYQVIQERLGVIPQEEKASETLYAQRLKSCRQCQRLTGGVCILCGCYVELRAAKAGMHCLDIPPKW